MADEKWIESTLEDVGHDTDRIIEELDTMSDIDTGALMGLLANKGIDPGIVAMLNDRRDRGDWGDGGLLILLFLIILMGGNGFGGFNRGEGVAGVDRTVVNEANYSRLLDAIGTQGTRQEVALQGLAQNFNCTTGQIQTALAGVDKQLAVNQGSIINAIQSCCCNIQGKVQDCCCQTNLNIERQGCQTRADIQDTRFLIQSTASAQDNLLQQMFNNQNQYLAEQFCAIRTREDQREINSLRERLAEQRDQANTLAILNAIAGRDTITGTYNATAATFTGNLS